MVTNRIDQSFEAILSHGLGPRDEAVESVAINMKSCWIWKKTNPYRTDIDLKEKKHPTHPTQNVYQTFLNSRYPSKLW